MTVPNFVRDAPGGAASFSPGPVMHFKLIALPLEQALANNHYQRLQRLAHQLKGAGGGYGYPSLTEAAKILEDTAKAKDVEAANLALNELNASCRAVISGRPTDVLSQEADS